MNNRFLLTHLLLALLLTLPIACDSNDGDDETPPADVFVANGGNFSDQNGSVTAYDPETANATNLGDQGAFVQGLHIEGNRLFVLMNTFSVGAVGVLNTETGSLLQRIDVGSPRDLALLDENTAYVTNLSAFGAAGPEPGIVSRVDLATGTAVAAITVGLFPEGILLIDGLLYVANNGNLGDATVLSIVDPSSNTVIEELDIGCDGPNELFEDGGGELIVVCLGKTVFNDDFTEIVEETNGQVVFLNPSSGTVTSRTDLGRNLSIGGSGGQNAFYDPVSQELYVLSSTTEEILRFDTRTNAMTATIAVPNTNDLTGLGGVAYDGSSELIYAARFATGPGGFADFTSSGAVVLLDRSGSQTGRFTVGPSPTHIALAR